MFARLTRARKRVSLWAWLPIVSHAQSKRAVVLTFDDGPSPETTPQVLAILKRHGALATFFFSGARAAAHPELVEAAVSDGHAVFPHGYDHVRMDGLDDTIFEETLNSAESLFRQHRPTPSPYYVRLPYAAGHGSSANHRRIRRWKADAQIMHWAYSFHDWTLADDCATIEELKTRCFLAARQAVAIDNFAGSIVLLHEDPHDVASPLKAEIAPLLLEAILSRMADMNISTSNHPKKARALVRAIFRPYLVKA